MKLEEIEKIEKYLKLSINITGDYIYLSNVKSNKIINLKLINEHYTLDIKPQKEELNNNKKVSFYNKNQLYMIQ